MNKNTNSQTNTSSSKVRRVITVVIADLALLALVLCTFAYFHHVRPHKGTEEPIVIERPVEATPAPVAETPEHDADTTPVPTEEVPMTWKEKFADKFSDTGIIQTENSFISENTHVTITKVEATLERSFRDKMHSFPLVYYVADIYITDVEQFAAAFPKGEYMPNTSGSTLYQIRDNNGVVGVNGDNYGTRQLGLVIRNGVLYRDRLFEGDVMVLYYDGTMEPIFYDDINIDDIVAKSPYQGWSFGPILVKDGQPVSHSTLPDYIRGSNPRTAIGYFEPGHYCMIVVEGRDDKVSIGVDINELTDIFMELGCESAYNMDGGATAAMVYNDEYVNVRASGGRHSTDTILILDPNYIKETE